MTKVKKRYETVSYQGIKGIRKDLKSGSFRVEKYIRGERFNATFDNIADAADWKKNFHPSLSLEPKSKSRIKENAQIKIEALIKNREIKKINGNDLGYTFADVWEHYKEKHLSTVEESTRWRRLRDAIFYEGLMNFKMIDFNAGLISQYLLNRKEQAINKLNSRRFNFDNDLKNLKAIFNWYIENCDEQFSNPILKRHKKEGVIRKVPRKKKKLKKHELLAFFKCLEEDSLFWRDFAEAQFFLSSRVQEPAGLLHESVDLEDRVLRVENVVVWGEDKKFLYLKDSPKNNEDRDVFMNDRLFFIIQRRLMDIPSSGWIKCPRNKRELRFVFHINGKPLGYREIQYRYNKALKKAGLSHKYSATHIMRHTMANMVRSELGLDSAQAVGGWKTRDLVENVYTETPTHIGGEARSTIEGLLYNGSTNPPQNPAQASLKILKN